MNKLLLLLYFIQVSLFILICFFYFSILNLKNLNMPPTININNPARMEMNIYNNTRTNAIVKYNFPRVYDNNNQQVIQNLSDDIVNNNTNLPYILTIEPRNN